MIGDSESSGPSLPAHSHFTRSSTVVPEPRQVWSGTCRSKQSFLNVVCILRVFSVDVLGNQLPRSRRHPGWELLAAFPVHSFKVVSKRRHQHLYKSGKPPLENSSLLHVHDYSVIWIAVACKEACAPGSNAPRSPELRNPRDIIIWFFWTMCPDCLVYMSNLKLCLRFFRQDAFQLCQRLNTCSSSSPFISLMDPVVDLYLPW